MIRGADAFCLARRACSRLKGGLPFAHRRLAMRVLAPDVLRELQLDLPGTLIADHGC
jgi:hypothetical protein